VVNWPDTGLFTAVEFTVLWASVFVFSAVLGGIPMLRGILLLGAPLSALPGSYSPDLLILEW